MNPLHGAGRCWASVGPAVGLRSGDSDVAGSAAVLRPNVIFIETTLRLAYGTRVTVVLPPVHPLGEVELPGIVRWWNARGLGIQLDRPRPRELWAVHRLMEREAAAVKMNAVCVPIGACDAA